MRKNLALETLPRGECKLLFCFSFIHREPLISVKIFRDEMNVAQN